MACDIAKLKKKKRYELPSAIIKKRIKVVKLSCRGNKQEKFKICTWVILEGLANEMRFDLTQK